MQISPAARALVVDDEPLVSVLIEDILQARGYAVTVANNRQQLEEALTTDRFELAVTDTDLASYPEMRAWNIDNIILCSGKPRAALEAEFPGLPRVLKPFAEDDFDALLQVVRMGSRGPASAQERLE